MMNRRLFLVVVSAVLLLMLVPVVSAAPAAPGTPTLRWITTSPTTASSAKGISFHVVVRCTVRGITSAHVPKIRRMFAILLPIMFPIAISAEPASADCRETTSSGVEVPNATIVSPITRSDIPKRLAIEPAPSTKKSAPLIRSAKPTQSIRRVVGIWGSIRDTVGGTQCALFSCAVLYKRSTWGYTVCHERPIQ